MEITGKCLLIFYLDVVFINSPLNGILTFAWLKRSRLKSQRLYTVYEILGEVELNMYLFTSDKLHLNLILKEQFSCGVCQWSNL